METKRIAVVSKDNIHVDDHFGPAKKLKELGIEPVVYEGAISGIMG